MYYVVLDYRGLADDETIAERSTMQPTCLNTCVGIVITCVEGREKRGGHRHNVSASTITSHLREGVDRLIGSICQHVNI